jgi:patatin-like phospholipase/acyl hydrolase
VDGGVFANNPSMCAYVEGVKLWPDKPVSDYCMLSIGTGKVIRPYSWEKTHKFGFIQWLQPIIDVLSSSVGETVDFQVRQLFTAGGVADSYVRIEPDLLSADSRMDYASLKNIAALEEAARYYIENNEHVFDHIISEMIGSKK